MDKNKLFLQIALVVTLCLCIVSIAQRINTEKETKLLRNWLCEEQAQTLLAVKSAFLSGWEEGYKKSAWDSFNNANCYKVTTENGQTKLWKQANPPK